MQRLMNELIAEEEDHFGTETVIVRGRRPARSHRNQNRPNAAPPGVTYMRNMAPVRPVVVEHIPPTNLPPNQENISASQNNYAPPTNNAIQDLTRQNIARASAAVAPLQKDPDKTYVTAFKKFQQFCAAKRRVGIVTSTEDLCQENINLYFSEVITHLKVHPNTARKNLVGIQWYINNKLPLEKKFSAESDEVETCLFNQKLAYQNSARNGNLPDPHSGLRINILSHDEYQRVMKYIYSESPQWEDLAITWN